MSEGRPRLVAVDGEGRGDRPAAGRQGIRPGDLGRWLLVGACIVLLLGLLHEIQQSRRLEADLARSRSELSAARAALAASNARIDEARTRTRALSEDASSLAGRLRELDGLLAAPSPRPPGPPAPSRPAAPPAP